MGDSVDMYSHFYSTTLEEVYEIQTLGIKFFYSLSANHPSLDYVSGIH